MRYIHTTETAVKKIKALGRQISRERGIELHEGHLIAARVHGYEDMHHVMHCASIAQESAGAGQPGHLIAQALREAERFTLKENQDNFLAMDEKLSGLLLGWRKRPGGLSNGPTEAELDCEKRFHAALAGAPLLFDAVGWWYDAQLAYPVDDSFAVVAVLERSMEQEALPVARLVANPVAVGRRIGRWLGAKVTVARTATLCTHEPLIGFTLWQMDVQLLACRDRSTAGDAEEGDGEELPGVMLAPGSRYVIPCLIECKKGDTSRVRSLLQQLGAMRGAFTPVLGRGDLADQHAIQTLALGAQSMFAWYDRHVFDAIALMGDVEVVHGKVPMEIDMGVHETAEGEAFDTEVWARINTTQQVATRRSERVAMPLGAQQAIARNLGRNIKVYYMPLGTSAKA
jgi:hypothetical protein